MRLHTFISENLEEILQEWENFARELWPGKNPSVLDLRNDAEEMLLSIISDMQTDQSDAEQHDKSVGKGQSSATSDSIDMWSTSHAESRFISGFDLIAMVAEYRALRASILCLWGKAYPTMRETQISDMTRFNECMDQLLAKSIQSYTSSINQSRELFLGILGHDLKTPLCAISTAAGLLAENKELNGSARRLASLIVASGQAMKSLITDMLDFTVTRLGMKISLVKQWINLVELGGEVMEEVKAAHPSHVFQLEANGSGKGEWDRQRLRQLISNLLANAVEHGASEAPIQLRIMEEEEHAVLQVCNQGPPIPAAAQSVIFDPLRGQCEGGFSKHSGNLGLGLYIAREVANAHGGDIEVSSDERETVFTVRLPKTVEAQPIACKREDWKHADLLQTQPFN